MKSAFRMFKRVRSGGYYIQNNSTGEQRSLGTKDKATAKQLWETENNAGKGPALNLQLAKVYWGASAPKNERAYLAGNVNLETRVLSYQRKKTGEWCSLEIAARLEALLKQLPSHGYLFPKIATLSENDRAAEFYRRCRILGIKGISLHSYRYA